MSLKIGDVVRPKSGGRRMTVIGVSGADGHLVATCRWVQNGKLCEATIRALHLRKSAGKPLALTWSPPPPP